MSVPVILGAEGMRRPVCPCGCGVRGVLSKKRCRACSGTGWTLAPTPPFSDKVLEPRSTAMLECDSCEDGYIWGHARGCKCRSCLGKRNRRKGQASQAPGPARRGGNMNEWRLVVQLLDDVHPVMWAQETTFRRFDDSAYNVDELKWKNPATPPVPRWWWWLNRLGLVPLPLSPEVSMVEVNGVLVVDVIRQRAVGVIRFPTSKTVYPGDVLSIRAANIMISLGRGNG